jgi:hypothetical protein
LKLRFEQTRFADDEVADKTSNELRQALLQLDRIYDECQVVLEGMDLSAATSDARTSPQFGLRVDQQLLNDFFSLMDNILLDRAFYNEFLRSKELHEAVENYDATEDALNIETILAEPDADPEIDPSILVTSYEEPLGSDMHENRSAVFSDTKSIDERIGRLRSESAVSVARVSVNSDFLIPGGGLDPSETSSLRAFESTNGGNGPRFLTSLEDGAFTWSTLSRINAKVFTEAARATYGIPVVLTIRGGFLAIGTSLGYVLIFDTMHKMVAIVGNESYSSEYGAVTAIGLSPTGKFVVNGHDKGGLVVWSTEPPQIVKVVPRHGINASREQRKSGHANNAAITAISFSEHAPNEFISANSQGYVYYHIIQQTLFLSRIDTFMVASARQQQGGIFALEFLRKGTQAHFTDGHGYFAYLTPSHCIVIATKPQLRILYRVENPTPTSLGCLAWCSPSMFSMYPARIRCSFEL